jgi:dihydrofolate synthase / folylpolyglutamate synthase
MGISKEKDIPGICYELAPLADAVILTKSKVKRAEEPDFIAKFIKGKKAIVTGSVGEAMEKARAMAGAEDMILVTGSFFVIAEAK